MTLSITKIIEQESLDVSIFGSADGATWGAKSIAAFPQKFYFGESPLLLDLTAHSDVKFVRAHWEVARWGRGVETPMFEFGVTLKEVPAKICEKPPPKRKRSRRKSALSIVIPDCCAKTNQQFRHFHPLY